MGLCGSRIYPAAELSCTSSGGICLNTPLVGVVCREGEQFKLGSHQLVNWESREKEDFTESAGMCMSEEAGLLFCKVHVSCSLRQVRV